VLHRPVEIAGEGWS